VSARVTLAGSSYCQTFPKVQQEEHLPDAIFPQS
jgi:hypothetical protein